MSAEIRSVSSDCVYFAMKWWSWEPDKKKSTCDGKQPRFNLSEKCATINNSERGGR